MKIELINLKNDQFDLKASYFRHEDEKSKGLALVLPGAGYSFMGPCIYYPSTQLFEMGYEVLNIEYDFRWNRHEGSGKESYSDLMQFLDSEVEKMITNNDLIILSKSIGTRFLATSRLEASKLIWLTPALKDDFVGECIKENNEKSLVVIGDKDPFYEESILKSVKNKLVIVGADHSLDVDGDLNKSLDEMKSIILTIKSFIEP